MIDLFTFAAANARAEFEAPPAKPARLIPSAGHGYTVRYARTGGHSHALDCSFCLFTAYPRDHRQPGDAHAGDSYGRAKRAIVSHILGQHADEFSAAQAPQPGKQIA